MSNVANPASFYILIESAGAEIVHKAVFPDHHVYQKNEIEKIAQDASLKDVELIVTTEKDERNFPQGLSPLPMKILVLEIDVEFLDDENEYLKIICP